MESCLVQVEAGLPCFIMVGHLSGEVRESAERVRIALKNNGIPLPAMHIAVNLSPADVRKEGTGFDLPVALAVLTAMERLTEKETEGMMILGELGLNGEIRKVRGILPMVGEGLRAGITRFLVPLENLQEARLIGKGRIAGIGSLTEAVEYLKMSEAEQKEWENKSIRELMTEKQDDLLQGNETEMDFSEVSGQESGKRAAMIAAAGFHHLLFCGPPGCGKTMLARRLPTILPAMTQTEQLETSMIYSVAGKLSESMPIMRQRPFRELNRTTTPAGILGGGLDPQPGEVSLAHNGILFIDEFLEFGRQRTELLRPIFSTAHVIIWPGKVSGHIRTAAANPCPCGYLGDENHPCTCTRAQIDKYRARLSGPLCERIDMCVEIRRVSYDSLTAPLTGSSAEMREKVLRAREAQSARLRGTNIKCNAKMQARELQEFCRPDAEGQAFLKLAYERYHLSPRRYHKILKLARTIADVQGEEEIRQQHLAGALQYTRFFEEEA